ncbi:MAG: sulfatase-like hydrolase/transferase [Gemmatimonadaceae bacterium]|nr:sulfatase-like hydrolase/transferase [Gemmatimonadaceae bacterium]
MSVRRAVALLALPMAAIAQTRPTTPPRPAVAAAAANVPNIIMLIVDDLGWQDLSVPLYRDTTAANRRYRTPAIEQLAAQGVAFTDAYAAAPDGVLTRAALLSGVANRIPAGGGPTPLLPRLLRTAGYRTIHVGKTDWGAGASAADATDAKALGFDESWPGARRADSLTADAIRAIDVARALQKPFFLYLAYDAVHHSGAGDGRFLDEVRGRTLDERDAEYASRIAGVDQSVREISRYLATTALTEQTLVVLLSDNGGLAASTRSGLRDLQNAPLRSGMGSAYEGGLRVPMIVRWPRVARAGLRASTPVVATDLFPTLLRAARVPNATQLAGGVKGQDLATTLANTKPVPFDRPLLWHNGAYSTKMLPGSEPFSAVRSGIWKLIYFYVGSRYELYDLSNDIGEGHEQSMKQPEIAARMSEVLRSALIEAKVPMPIDSAYGRPFGLPGRLLVPRP